MKTLTLIVLLFTSQFTYATLSSAEQRCLLLSTYHEARSLSETDWLKVASVATNRKEFYEKYGFGSVSSNLCDIVKSKQYTSSKLLNKHIREPKILSKMRKVLQSKRIKTKYLFFTSRNGTMHYKRNFK